MKIVCLIDGDNNPPKGADGIELLNADDSVIVFYAANNPFYSKASNRQALQSLAVCKVEFIQVPPGKNSVDFAVAIEASKLYSGSRDARIYLLISQDKHFDIIERQLMRQHRSSNLVQRVSSIRDGMEHFFLFKASTADELKQLLKKYYGAQGANLYRQLREIFIPWKTAKAQRNPLTSRKRLKEILGFALHKFDKQNIV